MLKNIFNFYLGSPSSGGSLWRVRPVIVLGKSKVLGHSRPGSRGGKFFCFFVALSAARKRVPTMGCSRVLPAHGRASRPQTYLAVLKTIFNWVPEGSLAGIVLGCVFEVWPAPGARKSLQKRGGRSPPDPQRRIRTTSRLKSRDQFAGEPGPCLTPW